jgi:hypothetical protein
MKKGLPGCFAVIILAFGLLVVLGGYFRYMLTQPLLAASLSLPNDVEQGETIPLIVTVENPYKETVTLDSIDIDDALLAGFQVISIDPKPETTQHVPLLKQRTWNYGHKIQPGGSLVVTFQIKAVSPGRFSGDIDVCNPQQNFISLLADVIVNEGKAASRGEPGL